MTKIVFIADFFADQVPGGGELNNEILIRELSKTNQITKVNSHKLERLADYNADKYIISNFIHLKEEVKNQLIEFKNYAIYEHDHKYLKSRNPASYKNFLAPKSEIINEQFYSCAEFVYSQSLFHKQIIYKNLNIDNIINMSGNLWDPTKKELFLHLVNRKKRDRSAIMLTNNHHKNTIGSVNYCKSQNLDYELIPPLSHEKFLDKLSNNKQLVFFPQTPETLSRIAVEARMLNMGLVTNGNLGAATESWFSMKGTELIEYVFHEMQQKILDHVKEFLNE